MPFGEFINILPPPVFLVIHLALFLVGAYLAKASFDAKQSTLGQGFALFAVAEILYMTYHLNLTVFLFAHTLAEVADVLGFVLVFLGAKNAMMPQKA